MLGGGGEKKPTPNLVVVEVKGGAVEDGGAGGAVESGAVKGGAVKGPIAPDAAIAEPISDAASRDLAWDAAVATESPSEGGKSGKANEADDASDEKASLTIRVIPWATVTVDGKNYGQTPQTMHLRRGKHRIVLENSGLDRRESFSMTLKSGQKKTVNKNWQ